MTTNLKFHPLADIFPLMEGAEFDALVADIKANGLRERIDLYESKIIDGRNRYRALLELGIDPEADPKAYFRKAIYAHAAGGEIAPHERNNDERVRAYVVSKNIHRRHLTAEQKRDLIATLLKADPGKSDRQIGRMTKADNKTVASVRTEQERREEIPHVSARTDTKGRQQPAKKSAPKPKPIKSDPRIIAPKLAERVGRFAHDLITTDRLLARELATIIMSPGVRERLWADLKNGLMIIAGNDSDPEGSAEARKAEFAAICSEADELKAEPRLNSIGKPLSPHYDPNWKHKTPLTSIGRLWKSQSGMRFKDTSAPASESADGADPGPLPECLRRG